MSEANEVPSDSPDAPVGYESTNADSENPETFDSGKDEGQWTSTLAVEGHDFIQLDKETDGPVSVRGTAAELESVLSGIDPMWAMGLPASGNTPVNYQLPGTQSSGVGSMDAPLSADQFLARMSMDVGQQDPRAMMANPNSLPPEFEEDMSYGDCLMNAYAGVGGGQGFDPLPPSFQQMWSAPMTVLPPAVMTRESETFSDLLREDEERERRLAGTQSGCTLTSPSPTLMDTTNRDGRIALTSLQTRSIPVLTYSRNNPSSPLTPRQMNVHTMVREVYTYLDKENIQGPSIPALPPSLQQPSASTTTDEAGQDAQKSMKEERTQPIQTGNPNLRKQLLRPQSKSSRTGMQADKDESVCWQTYASAGAFSPELDPAIANSTSPVEMDMQV